MSVNEKMTAIANAIRGKTGGTELLTLDEMTTAIGNIDTCIFPHSEIPTYVKNEVTRVITAVKEKQTDNTITFLAISDAHQLASNSNIVNGNTHAGMAMKSLAYALNLDFACCLGDLSWGSNTTTIAEGKAEIEAVNRYISEAFEGLTQFRTVGNHDAQLYSYSQNGEILTDEYLFSQFGAFCEGAVYGSTTKGYCYRDFEDKKIRVICLNTAEMTAGYNASAGLISPTQQTWFANALLNVGSKSNASEWGVIILAHHPLDWGAVCYGSNILKAYANGESITVNGSTVNFSGKNNAKVIAQIHGHTHGFKVDYLYTVNTSSWSAGEQYNVKRIAIPNMCYDRANDYGQNSGTDSNGIEFGTTKTYNKTANTADDTAFCVVVVNLDTKVISAICYGAGIDREIAYSADVHTVTTNLTGCTYSGVNGVLDGTTFTTTITLADKHELKSISVKMGGVDITSSAVSGTTITIANVTGDIVITAVAEKQASYTNIIDTIGYEDNMRLSTSSGTTKSASGGVTTGLIDISSYSYPVTIRTKGVDFSKNENRCAIAIYTNATGTLNKSDFICNFTDNNITISFDSSGNLTMTVTGTHKYFKLCGIGSGANLIVTVNEEIT